MNAQLLLSVVAIVGAQGLATDYAQYEIVPGSIRDFSTEEATRLQVSATGKRWATVTLNLNAVRLGSRYPGARVASERRLLAVDCNTGGISIQQLSGFSQPGLAGVTTETITAHYFGEAENFRSAWGFAYSDDERTRGFGHLIGSFLNIVCEPPPHR